MIYTLKYNQFLDTTSKRRKEKNVTWKVNGSFADAKRSAEKFLRRVKADRTWATSFEPEIKIYQGGERVGRAFIDVGDRLCVEGDEGTSKKYAPKRPVRYVITGTDKRGRRFEPIYTNTPWHYNIYKGTLWEIDPNTRKRKAIKWF